MKPIHYIFLALLPILGACNQSKQIVHTDGLDKDGHAKTVLMQKIIDENLHFSNGIQKYASKKMAQTLSNHAQQSKEHQLLCGYGSMFNTEISNIPNHNLTYKLLENGHVELSFITNKQLEPAVLEFVMVKNEQNDYVVDDVLSNGVSLVGELDICDW